MLKDKETIVSFSQDMVEEEQLHMYWFHEQGMDRGYINDVKEQQERWVNDPRYSDRVLDTTDTVKTTLGKAALASLESTQIDSLKNTELMELPSIEDITETIKSTKKTVRKGYPKNIDKVPPFIIEVEYINSHNVLYTGKTIEEDLNNLLTILHHSPDEHPILNEKVAVHSVFSNIADELEFIIAKHKEKKSE